MKYRLQTAVEYSMPYKLQPMLYRNLDLLTYPLYLYI
nr:MAG TPA: hypothetical protein [Bacteriophage sp.]